LYYREAFAGRFYHIDVVVNDCDGPGHDKSRLCDRDPSNTISIFWGGPEINDRTLTPAQRVAGFAGVTQPWGQVVAASSRHSNVPNSADFPDAITLAQEMSNDQDSSRVITVLFNSEPCDKQIAAMEVFKQQVMNAGIPYHPANRNSNGVAYGYLEAASITQLEGSQHRALVQGYTSSVYDIASGRVPNRFKRRPQWWECLIPPMPLPPVTS